MPFQYYAILTLLAAPTVTLIGKDFGPMFGALGIYLGYLKSNHNSFILQILGYIITQYSSSIFYYDGAPKFFKNVFKKASSNP
jgi:hypothetical protein